MKGERESGREDGQAFEDIFLVTATREIALRHIKGATHEIKQAAKAVRDTDYHPTKNVLKMFLGTLVNWLEEEERKGTFKKESG